MKKERFLRQLQKRRILLPGETIGEQGIAILAGENRLQFFRLPGVVPHISAL